MDKFNTKHFMFVIWGVAIVSLKTYPNIIIKHGGRDSWIATLVASILILLFVIYIMKICVKTNSYNMYEIYTSSLGRNFGYVFYLLFMFTLFLTMIECGAVEANSMHQNMLLETPVWYILAFLVLGAAYCVKKGLRSLVIITIVGIIGVMAAGINLGILTAKYKENKFLYPILENGYHFGLIIATIKALGFYASVAIIFPFINEVFDKKNLVRFSIAGMIIVIQMEVYALMGIITTFGYKRALTIYYPKLIQTQLVSHFDFLESGELFVMLQIVGGWFMKYCLTFYALLKLIEAISDIPKKKLIPIISLVAFVAAYYSGRNGFILLKLLVIYNYISVVNFVLIPTLVFSIFLVRHSKNKSKKPTDESNPISIAVIENSTSATEK